MTPEPADRPTGPARLRGLVARVALPALAVGVLYAVRPGVVENGVRSPRLWLVVVAIVLVARLVSVGVRRATGRPRAASLASNAVVAVAVVALLAPSFTQRELDEPLGATSGAAMTGSAADGAVPAQGGADEGAVEPAPSANGPRELWTAQLDGVGHEASGRARLVAADGQVVLRFEDVDVEGTPGPRVHLVPAGERTPDGGVDLGPLKAERGSFGYVVPADVDLERAWTVLVWCRPFATPIAAADLAPVV